MPRTGRSLSRGLFSMDSGTGMRICPYILKGKISVKKVSEFFEKNRNGDTAVLVCQGEMNFLWLEMNESELILCDFDGMVYINVSDYDVEGVVVDWLNSIHADPATAKDVTFFTPVYKNGKFEIK